MTVREVYNSVLVELNKVQAPSILLEDFVYLLNKSIQRYINKKYNVFEMNQQLTDDLRVLIKSTKINEIKKDGKSTGEWKLPDDYMHILNCTCEFAATSGSCSNLSSIIRGACKLDTASLPHVIENYYMKPSAKRPYYYICYINNPSESLTPKTVQEEQTPGYYDSENGPQEGIRYGNSQVPVIQIKSGSTTPTNVDITYLRTPKYVDLTVNDLDDIYDKTEHLEFPDYVVYEIINELTALILENSKDPRLQTHIPVAQTIITPGMSKQS